MIRLQAVAKTDVGIMRQMNQDYCYANTNETGLLPNLFIVADGMGGHNGGEIASSDVLHNLQFFFSDLPATLSSGDFDEAIYDWLKSINSILDSKGRADVQYRDMGTTLVTLTYYNKRFYWMNCGDSRIYRLHGEELQQVSTDHSLNSMTGDKVHTGIITNCVGGGCQTSFIDMNECTDVVKPGDIWVLCSDGLSDMIDDEEIKQMLLDGADAQKLCDAAVAAGGFDNVSACVVKIV